MPARPPAAVLAALAVVLAVAAPPPMRAADATVSITSTLTPAALTVASGTTVTWRNDDTTRHRIRTTAGPTDFDSGDLDPGQTFSVQLSALGTYAYRDERNTGVSAYWGTIAVTASPTPSPAASPGASLPPGATPPPPAPVTIHLAGRAFTPPSVTVDAGTAVTWVNDDTREHTATSLTNAWGSGRLAAGASFTRTFTVPGTFPYLCLLHPDMTGTIAVRGTGGATPPPPVATASPTPPAPIPTLAPGATAPPPVAATAEIRDFVFAPANLRVTAGSTITWRNAGVAPHTVTAADGSFDSGILAAGGSWTHRFGTPGRYAFVCAVHLAMTGTIVVDAPGGSAAVGSGDPGPGTGASQDPPASAGPPDAASPGPGPSGGLGGPLDPGTLVPGAGEAGAFETDAAVLRALLAAVLIAAAVTLFGLGLGSLGRRPSEGQARSEG